METTTAHKLAELLTMDNIAEHLEPVELNRIGNAVIRDVEIDLDSRKEAGWDKRNEAAMKAAMQVREPKDHPWPGASNVKYPLLTVAAIQFQARAYPAIVDGATLVKGRVLGDDAGKPKLGPDNMPIMQPATNGVPGIGDNGGPPLEPVWEVPPGQKRDRADRVANYMTYQLMYKMDGWEEDTDRLLLMLPILGCAIRKTYHDDIVGGNVSMMLAPEDFIINYWAKSIEAAPRFTHRLRYYPYEAHEKIASGEWLDVKVEVSEDPKAQTQDEDAQVVFYEQHRRIDLDGDGYPEPYVVTTNIEGQVARIAPCFAENDITFDTKKKQVASIKREEYFTKYPFIPSPDGAFYDIGFGMLLGDISAAVDTIINQMIDAASLQNAQGGFLGAGVNIKSGNMKFRLGEWKRVDTGGGTLRENILPLNLPGPSATMFQLLGLLIEAAKDITSVQDIMTGGPATAQTATTTMAQVEQGMKTFTGIFKRIHRAFRKELQILFRLNGQYLPEEEYFALTDEPAVVGRADFLADDLDVVPVSDPSLASDLQKLARADYLATFIGNPDVNQKEITRRRLEAGNVQDIKTMMDVPPPQPPLEFMQKQAELANTRDQTKAEIRAKDAATAASLVATAKAAAELGSMTGNAAMTQFASDLAAESDELARGVMAEAAHEGGETPQEETGEHSDGQGAVPEMGGASGDDSLPGLPPEAGAGDGGAMALGPELTPGDASAGGGPDGAPEPLAQ